MRFARMNAILSFGFMARSFGLTARSFGFKIGSFGGKIGSFGFIKTGVTLGGSEGHPRRLGG